MTYSAPKITPLGSVRDFTLAVPALNNKVGLSADAFTAATQGTIVGSIVPPQ